MKTIHIHKQKPYYSMVMSGTKKIEGRLNKGKFAELEIGDILVMFPGRKRFKVKGRKNYKTFKEMLENEGIKNVLPDKNSIAEGMSVYRQFYNKRDEKKFGVIAIKIKPID